MLLPPSVAGVLCLQGAQAPLLRNKAGASPRLSFGSFLCVLPHVCVCTRVCIRTPYTFGVGIGGTMHNFLFVSFSLWACSGGSAVPVGKCTYKAIGGLVAGFLLSLWKCTYKTIGGLVVAFCCCWSIQASTIMLGKC